MVLSNAEENNNINNATLKYLDVLAIETKDKSNCITDQNNILSIEQLETPLKELNSNKCAKSKNNNLMHSSISIKQN